MGNTLRENKSDVEYLRNGAWKSLTDMWNPHVKKKIKRDLTRSDTTEVVKARHDQLYGSKKVPNEWVFNDFGHMTCYYFKDVNGDRKLSAGEKLKTEYLHTTTVNEAEWKREKDRAAATGETPLDIILLDESHGCVHVKPAEIDTMIAKGYLKKGNSFVVHKYTETPPVGPIVSGRPPFSVHFYPGSKLIQVRAKKVHKK